MGYIGWPMLRSGQMLSNRHYGGCGYCLGMVVSREI